MPSVKENLLALLLATIITIPAPSYGTEGKEEQAGVLSSNPDDIKFYLWPNPSNRSYYEELIYNDEESLRSSSYNPSKSVKFLVHGFLRNGRNEEGMPGTVKNAYLMRDEDHSYNIISVGWGKLARPSSAGPLKNLYYVAVVKNVEIVGHRLGHFVVWLHNKSMLQIDATHFVGHSLGCHVSGWAGDTVKNLTGRQIDRISALDPAGPLFYTDIRTRTIRPFDAKFVDAYHTSAGELGTTESVGAVDFFINGGLAPQPGCSPTNIGCSHQRAHEYFAQTILEDDPARNPNASRCVCVSAAKFRVNRECCDHKLLFGEFCRPNTTGKYYVRYELSGQKDG